MNGKWWRPVIKRDQPCRIWLKLRRALDNSKLVMHYQPKTFLSTDELRGVEALLRWNHPQRGLMMPDDFIPYAEHTALIDEMGVEVSIDDFGTGQSSLAYLTTLPIPELKIDRSFVTHMCSRADDAVIVRSVTDLGHNLGQRVVAESVEDTDTREQLFEAGCLVAQGYLWSRPLAVDALDAWLDSHHAVRR